jgi:valyl-tRNA synthetase
LARADSIAVSKVTPRQAALMVVGEATIAMPLEGIIDMDAERKRLEKEIAKAESDLGKAQTWLSNESNVANSPEHVVALNRERVSGGADRIARLKAALKQIEA